MRRLKNFIIKISTPRPKQHKLPGEERFLIVSTTGLGDTLWATPALRALRAHHPSSYIAVLTGPIGAEALKNNPHIDETFVVKSPALFSLILLYRKIKKKNISTALIFHASQRPILPFCAWIGACRIVGTEGINKGLDFLLTDALKDKKVHEIIRRLEIAGCPEGDTSLELFVREESPFVSKKSPLIGLHPGAKDKFKQWPPSHFAAIGRLLQKELGAQIVVTGGKEEKALAEEVASQIEGAVAITQHLSIETLAALIGKMQLLICNDTGPMHIAAAMKTAVVAPFAPTDARLCGPLTNNSCALQKPKTCSPCLKKKCRDPFCMRQISVDEILKEALKLLLTREVKR